MLTVKLKYFYYIILYEFQKFTETNFNILKNNT